MTKFFLLLALSFSCTQNKPSQQGNKGVEANNISDTLSATKVSEKLEFTSPIRAIFQDRKGNYWFGSHQEGVCFFDGKVFHYFTVEDGLSNNQVRTIQEDQDGVIWFGTGNGVSSYDGVLIKNRTGKTGISTGWTPTESWAKTDNDLWFNAGTSPGVYRYDGQNLSYLAFPDSKVINPNNTYLVTGVSKGKDDMMWIGTFAGVFGYDGQEFTIINDETLWESKKKGLLHIRSILEDSKGRLWIGNNGIGVLLKENETIINFSDQKNLIHPASERIGDVSPSGTLEHVFVISEDANGNIWFADRDTGVWKYDGKTMHNYTEKDGLTTNFAQAIYKDHQGQLWFGLEDGRVFTFNGKSFDKRF